MRKQVFICLIISVFASLMMMRVPAERRAQVFRGGDDALSVAFGDAKETLSRAMNHKADSYYHGGVDIECTHDHETEHESEEEHHHKDDEMPEAPPFLDDPWQWINFHIKAPQIEKHLEGEKAVELMPWLWASVKADPHNIDAWTTAWFVAYDKLRDHKLSERIVREGRMKNPRSLELALTEGRQYYDKGKGDIVAAKQAFLAAKELALSLCGGKVEELSERDQWHYKFILEYLSKIESKESE